MFIKTANKEITINSVISTSFKMGTDTFPAFKILFPEEVLAEDVTEILSGSFDICDNEGNVMGTHEGYNTKREIALTVGKITTDEEKIMQLEESLANTNASLETANSTIADLEAENAELLFNSLTDEDFNTVTDVEEPSDEEVTA